MWKLVSRVESQHLPGNLRSLRFQTFPFLHHPPLHIPSTNPFQVMLRIGKPAANNVSSSFIASFRVHSTTHSYQATMKRIQREVSPPPELNQPRIPNADEPRTQIRDVEKEDMGDITLKPSESNVFNWTATIPGPEGSVYEGGVFKLAITLPPDYPYVATQLIIQIYTLTLYPLGSLPRESNLTLRYVRRVLTLAPVRLTSPRRPHEHSTRTRHLIPFYKWLISHPFADRGDMHRCPQRPMVSRPLAFQSLTEHKLPPHRPESKFVPFCHLVFPAC